MSTKASKTAAEARHNQVETMDVPVGDIRVADVNVHAEERKGDKVFDGLVESVRQIGIIHRLIVRRDGSGKYVIVDGHRRFAAAKAAGIRTLPVEVWDVGESGAMAMTVTANVQRTPNDPILEAEAIEMLVKRGNTQQTIAAVLGLDERYVARRARLIALTDKWRGFAKTHPFTTDCLEHIAAFDAELQDEVFDENELGNDEYEFSMPDNGVIDWEEFRRDFEARLYRIEDADFDASACAACPHNTNTGVFLAGFEEFTADKPRCQCANCYIKKQNDWVDSKVEELRRNGTPAKEVSDKWRIPEYYNTSEHRDAQHTQAYVYTDGKTKHMLWARKPAKEETRAAKTEAERKAEKAERARRKAMSAAGTRIRKALTVHVTKMDEVFDWAYKTQAFKDYARRLFRSYAGEYGCSYDSKCLEFIEMLGGIASFADHFGATFTDDERDALQANLDTRDADRRASGADGADEEA